MDRSAARDGQLEGDSAGRLFRAAVVFPCKERKTGEGPFTVYSLRTGLEARPARCGSSAVVISLSESSAQAAGCFRKAPQETDREESRLCLLPAVKRNLPEPLQGKARSLTRIKRGSNNNSEERQPTYG